MIFHFYESCTNAPQCYVIHTLPVLLKSYFFSFSMILYMSGTVADSIHNNYTRYFMLCFWYRKYCKVQWITKGLISNSPIFFTADRVQGSCVSIGKLHAFRRSSRVELHLRHVHTISFWISLNISQPGI
jgi:hypothetical protein